MCIIIKWRLGTHSPWTLGIEKYCEICNWRRLDGNAIPLICNASYAWIIHSFDRINSKFSCVSNESLSNVERAPRNTAERLYFLRFSCLEPEMHPHIWDLLIVRTGIVRHVTVIKSWRIVQLVTTYTRCWGAQSDCLPPTPSTLQVYVGKITIGWVYFWAKCEIPHLSDDAFQLDDLPVDDTKSK